MNQYEPWIELGLSELEYWKAKYLEARKRESELFDAAWFAHKILSCPYKAPEQRIEAIALLGKAVTKGRNS